MTGCFKYYNYDWRSRTFTCFAVPVIILLYMILLIKTAI